MQKSDLRTFPLAQPNTVIAKTSTLSYRREEAIVAEITHRISRTIFVRGSNCRPERFSVYALSFMP